MLGIRESVTHTGVEVKETIGSSPDLSLLNLLPPDVRIDIERRGGLDPTQKEQLAVHLAGFLANPVIPVITDFLQLFIDRAEKEAVRSRIDTTRKGTPDWMKAILPSTSQEVAELKKAFVDAASVQNRVLSTDTLSPSVRSVLDKRRVLDEESRRRVEEAVATLAEGARNTGFLNALIVNKARDVAGSTLRQSQEPVAEVSVATNGQSAEVSTPPRRRVLWRRSRAGGVNAKP